MKRFTLLLGTTLFIATATAHADAESIIQEGDHIAIVGNTFADQLRTNGYLETLLQQHADISLRNLGWAGDTLTKRDRPTNFPTEESTLTKLKSNVIIACFGMSESFAGDKGIATFKKDLKAFIASHTAKQYNGKTAAKIVIVSPIAYEDHGITTPNVAARNKDLAAYTAAAKQTAEQAGVSFIDLYTPTRAMIENAEGQKLTTNGIHLSPLGYWAVSRILTENLLEGSAQAWRLNIDAKSHAGTAQGVKLSALEASDNGFSFSVTETSAASPPPPADQPIPNYFTKNRDTLTVKNLQPGEYTLTIDGQKVASANHSAWAAGVLIDSSLSHQETELFRKEVNDKNLQFLYNWKALNQVHIVGERKRSPSGKSLSGEQVKFDQLAQQKEALLRKAREPKTREWKLIPNPTQLP